MGLSLGEMLDRTGKELVYIRHPENNKWVWCWVISEKDGSLISGGGDSIFDHVNSVRKADIEFLFGGLKDK